MNCLKTELLLILLVAACCLPGAKGQLPASTPLADPADTRFKGVSEDWTTPALGTSQLRAARPLTAYINDYGTYTVELTQLQWRFGDPLDLYVMKPKGISKPPVIIYLYGFPADTDRFKDDNFQKAVTKDGFAAVGFVSALTGQRYHDRPMREWFLSELQECLSTSAHDVQMILDFLQKRGDLDTDHVGMYAQGSGASIAILASAVDPRIKVLDLIDPWGDWPSWMTQSPFMPEDERRQYVKHEFLKKVAALDPVVWLPKVQARRMRLQDAIFEPNTPAAAKARLRAAVPPEGTVVIYKNPEEFNAVVQGRKELEWIETQVRPLPDWAPTDRCPKATE